MRIQPAVAPSRPLGAEGQRVWEEVVADYPVDNPAGAEILLLVCESVTGLWACARSGRHVVTTRR
jgi:hypothetical protein